MKLAEALLIRSDLQKKLAQLKGRISSNVRVQEGDTPAEDPEQLLKDASLIISELHSLIMRIHRTNAAAVANNGKPMLELLVERDSLQTRHKLLTDSIEAANNEEGRYSYREIKWQVILSIPALQKQADDLAQQLRQLNLIVQASNWQIDLEP